MATGDAPPDDGNLVLNLFCSKDEEGWRVHAGPHWLPRQLRDCFDRHREAYPVALDFDELERHMKLRTLEYDQRVSKTGSVELTARRRAAVELGVWLAAMLTTGIRAPGSDPGRVAG